MAQASPAARKPPDAGRRRLLHTIHSWLGLKLSVLLALVLVSGTLAVFREEIDWLLYPAMRVEPAAQRVGPEAMRAAILAAHPDVVFQAGFSTGADRRATAVGVIGFDPGLGVRIFWVDQYRGVFTGSTPYFSPGYVLAHLHRQLMLPVLGEEIVTALAFVLLASLVSGLVIYKRFWRGFLRRPRLRDLRTLLGDLHRLVALWSLWFVLLMVLTGAWYFWVLVAVPDFGAPLPHAEPVPPVLRVETLPQDGAVSRRVGLDAAVRIAEAHRPGFAAMYVEPPLTNRDVLAVHGTNGELLAPYDSVIFINPYDGSVVAEAHASAAPLVARIDHAVTPLHYGTWGGTAGPGALASKGMWFVFGTALSFLALSGVVISWRRLAARAGAHRSWLARCLWPRGPTLGWMKLPSLALLAGVLGGGYLAFVFMNGTSAAQVRELAPRALGTVMVAPRLDPGPAGGQAVDAPGARPYVTIADFDRLRLQFRSLAVARDGAGADGWQEVGGRGGVGVARLPPGQGGPPRLVLRAIGWDGQTVVAHW